MASWKRFLIGAPLNSDRAHEEKLSRPKALAIFASDALSSVAYATEEILLRLVAVGSLALSVSVPIATAIIALLWLLIISYRQTILKYPQGGGAYNVSKDNLGNTAGLVAGSSLLVDYVLTVSVSIAAGIGALIAAAPDLEPYRVTLNVVAIIAIGLVNLRALILADPEQTIEMIMNENSNVRIIVGGNAVKKLGDKAKDLGADYYLTTFNDIIAIAGGKTDETTV